MPADERPEKERPEDERREAAGRDDDASERSDDDSGGGLAFPAPFAPDKDDDSALGDTDQHSDA